MLSSSVWFPDLVLRLSWLCLVLSCGGIVLLCFWFSYLTLVLTRGCLILWLSCLMLAWSCGCLPCLAVVVSFCMMAAAMSAQQCSNLHAEWQQAGPSSPRPQQVFECGLCVLSYLCVCLVLSCLVSSCFVLPRLALSCLLSCLVLSFPPFVLFCLVDRVCPALCLCPVDRWKLPFMTANRKRLTDSLIRNTPPCPLSFVFVSLPLSLPLSFSPSLPSRQDNARQDKTRQDKARQDKTRQDKTRQANKKC